MRRLPFVLMLVVAGGSLSFAQLSRVGGGEIVFPTKDFAPARFSHEQHVGKAGLKCMACHNKLWTTRAKHVVVDMDQMEKRRVSCGACHTGTKVFSVSDSDNCEKCHSEK